MVQIASSSASLRLLFNDMDLYAWDLLECEVNIETCAKVDGRDIAKLLSLYMKGVERLNSLQDRREVFFKNKMTSLMMKPSVVKSLSNPPKLKQPQTKQNQVGSPLKAIKTPISPQKEQATKIKVQQPKEETPPPIYDLIKKKKEMQMHLTYESQEHTTEALNKLITQHNQKANTLNNKIEEIIQEGNKKIEEKIKMRKLKSQSARSKSQRNVEELKETRYKNLENIEVIKQQNEENVFGGKKQKKCIQRKYSLQVLKIQEPQSPHFQLIQKKRKCTFDVTFNHHLLPEEKIPELEV